MRITQHIIVICSMLLALVIGASAQERPEDLPRSIDIDLYYRQRWIMASPVVEEPLTEDSDATNSVFMSVMRFVDPRTSVPFDKSEPEINFDLNDLIHSFRLEKKSFLLGEPILVEHRIELNGPGELNWFVGGNYRARGRDDNFNFVLRNADGAIVPDVYPGLTGLIFGGGLGSDHTITKDKPLSYWLGLQRYSAITEPGVYDLYCLTGGKSRTFGRIEALRAALPEALALSHYVDDSGTLIDRVTGERSKHYTLVIKEHDLDSETKWPLAGIAPPEVLRFAGQREADISFARAGMFGTIGHFKISIRRGTRAEQREMTARWTKSVQSNSSVVAMGTYKSAILESIWYTKQDHFLSLLEEWIKKTANAKERFSSELLYLDGLAMRSDSAAFQLLLEASPKQVTNAFYRLHQSRIADAIPLCIQWLTDTDAQVRAMSESLLVRWTGQSFEHTWNGYHYARPTPAEGKSMQPLWRIWWQKNKTGFKPHEPCESPCETKTEK